MCDYEIERMKHCMKNNEYMQQLGLPVLTNPFANASVSLEKQNTGDSGSEYNVDDEPNSDDHPSDDNLEAEKDDYLQDLDTTISSLLANKNKTAKKVTKRGDRKAQPHIQAGTLTRSMTKGHRCVNDVTEASNQTTQEADAAQQNGCQNEGGDHTQGGIDSADDPFDEGEWMRGPNIGRKLDR